MSCNANGAIWKRMRGHTILYTEATQNAEFIILERRYVVKPLKHTYLPLTWVQPNCTASNHHWIFHIFLCANVRIAQCLGIMHWRANQFGIRSITIRNRSTNIQLDFVEGNSAKWIGISVKLDASPKKENSDYFAVPHPFLLLPRNDFQSAHPNQYAYGNYIYIL